GPPRGEGEPGRGVEHGRAPPGHGGSRISVPRAVLPARAGSPGAPEPMDHGDGPHRPQEGRSRGLIIGGTAAGRARTADLELFSLALPQTDLPRRAASELRTGQ